MSAEGDFDMQKEEAWSRGSAIGEAVWLRLCTKAGWDPKDPERVGQRGVTVDTVRGAFLELMQNGFEGLADWLDTEKWLEAGSGG